MNRQEIIDLLNTARANEFIAISQYMNHHYVAQGMDGVQVADVSKEHALTEMKHAEMLGERIVMLGGNPIAKPNEVKDRTTVGNVKTVEKGDQLEQILKQDLGDEYKAIRDYTDYTNAIGSYDIVTRRMVESILEQEQEHANDLEGLLNLEPQGVSISMGDETEEARRLRAI